MHAASGKGDFRPTSPFISETVRDRAIVTIDHYKVIADRSLSDPMTLSDRERRDARPNFPVRTLRSYRLT